MSFISVLGIRFSTEPLERVVFVFNIIWAQPKCPDPKGPKAVKNNMNQDTNAVETKVETAVPQQETVVTPSTTEVDYEAELKRKDAELAQIRIEKENYRKGMLKAKGKLPEEETLDTSTPEGLDELVDRKVQERLLATKEAQAQADKDEFIAAMARKNKELTLALKNRGQVLNPAGQVSNQEKPEGRSDTFFSNEQLNALKAKGFDDKKIEELKKNMKRGNEMPK